MSYSSRKAPKSFVSKLINFFIKAFIYFIFASIGAVLIYRIFPVPLTPLMIVRSVESVFSDKFVGIEKKWVSIDKIPKSMQRAVIKAEDYNFYIHSGFDWDAIEKAMKYNKNHKKTKGASTISQQTAKNVFLWPSRNWIRKGLEAYFTVLIELFWPKERILEVYLNVVELGNGIYGVEAASQIFFKRSAKEISNAQASLLAAVLPNPRKFRVDKPSAYILRRQAKIMNRSTPKLQEVQTFVEIQKNEPEVSPKNAGNISEEEQSLRDSIDLKLDSDSTESEPAEPESEL